MKTFQTGSNSYKACEKWLALDVEAMAEKLVQAGEKHGAVMQMTAINTMYQIVYGDSAHRNTNQADMLAVQIRNGQRERISHFGDKAFGLSGKQLAVIARDLVKIAIVFE